jgi:hypothetical protein
MLELLSADGGALVDEAVAAAPDVLDADALRALVEAERGDPELRFTEHLVRVVNMGLLQAMARGAAPDGEPDRRAVREVGIAHWDRDGEPLRIELVGRTPTLSEQTVLRFAPGVLVTRCTTGDRDFAQPGATYVIMNDRLAFVIEPELADWLAFLERVDGERTIAQALTDANLQASAIWKHLEEAIEFGVLAIS